MLPLTPRFPAFLHGGDYNPDQWLDRPDILERDVQLMQAAHVNCVSVGIFSWALLEPEEGHYDFGWLDDVIDRLWKGGIHVILATPSGARPAWMTQKYPEILRMNDQFRRRRFGERHNHCLSSPVYREKVRAMDTALAQRYSHHPAVILWHLSNEYSGACYCPLCQERFRAWLQDRYGDLETLNHAWWTSFWSQRFTDWEQILPPSSLGQHSNHGLQLDWKRFSTDQCRSFLRNERDAVKAVNPDLPCTANLMERFRDYDYFALTEDIDLVSWDAYPEWGSGDDLAVAAEFACQHDMMRSYKHQPFLLMESTPSLVNWRPHNRPKAPGMHLLSSMQAVAHGSQSVMYFQWRQGRGGAEMFHGAVVDHYGEEDTRTFRDVTEVGKALEKLAPIYDTQRTARACIIYDVNNLWALDLAQLGNKGDMRYFDTVIAHYRALWEQGYAVDFCDMRACTDLSGYALVSAPMLFMTRNGIEEKLRAFVEAGGVLLTTYLSGVVDESSLAHLGATPHGLTQVLGLRATELDALRPGLENAMRTPDGAVCPIRELCGLMELQGAEVMGTYDQDWYAGQPCLTRHTYGKGEAWYLAAKVDQPALNALYARLAQRAQLHPALPDAQPEGVIATARGQVIFLQNYAGEARTAKLDAAYQDLLTGREVCGEVELPPRSILVLLPLSEN